MRLQEDIVPNWRNSFELRSIPSCFITNRDRAADGTFPYLGVLRKPFLIERNTLHPLDRCVTVHKGDSRNLAVDLDLDLDMCKRKRRKAWHQLEARASVNRHPELKRKYQVPPRLAASLFQLCQSVVS
jgi:hypothetical protein